jgi:hypothetical protein
LLFRALRRTVGAKGVATDVPLWLSFWGIKLVELVTCGGTEYGGVSENDVDDRGTGNDAHAIYLSFWYSSGDS